MKIRFAGETYDLPPPVAAADEVVISVATYVPVDTGVAAATPAVSALVNFYNLGKILFFAFREGPALTLAKVRSVLLHRKLNRNRALVIAVGKDAATGRPAIALGGQDCPYAEQLCFPRALASVSGSGSADASQDFAVEMPALLAYCAANPDIAARLRDWSRFAGDDLPVTLADAWAKGKRLVSDGSAPAIPKAVAVAFREARAPDKHTPPPPAGGGSGLFLAGAGSYPCAYALPDFAKAGIPFDTVIDLNPVRAARVAKQFGFAFADTDTGRGLQRLSAYKAPILVIATYHSTHVEIAEQALAINPATRIMLEKPPVTTMDQRRRLDRLRRGGAYIEIGFNRRHIPMTIRARDRLAAQQGPVVMTCIVKELLIPPSHWYYWPAQGTRITGNTCHWLDLGTFFIAARPERMYLVGPHGTPPDGGLSLMVCYADGSRLNIVATDNGSSLRGVQEFIELRRGDLTLTIEDFMRLRVQQGARQSVRRTILRDKGHRRMYARFIANIAAGRPAEYPGDDLLATTMQYLRASAALQAGERATSIDLTED